MRYAEEIDLNSVPWCVLALGNINICLQSLFFHYMRRYILLKQASVHLCFNMQLIGECVDLNQECEQRLQTQDYKSDVTAFSFRYVPQFGWYHRL